MYSIIEVFFKNEFPDPLGNNIRSEIETFGFHGVSNIRVRQVYIIFGNISKNDMETIAQKLLVDTITQDYQIFDSGLRRERSVERFRTADFKSHIVEISRKPGVMDPIEQSVLKALSDIGINIDGVKTAQKYLIEGNISPETIRIIATRLLANTKIENVFIYPEMPNYDHGNIHYSFKKKTIPLLNADNKQLEEISTRGQLSLNLQEMQTIKKYYQSLRREPTDI